MKKTILSALLVLTQTSFAAESDNFSARLLPLVDAGEQVNALTNQYLKTAVNHLATAGCNEDALYVELRKYFANHSAGELTKDMLYKGRVPIYSLPIKQSVYQDWKVEDGYLLGKKSAATSPLALSPLILIGTQPIGVDKFEHMFGMGFDYFTKHYKKGVSIEHVLNYGGAMEKTILGGNIFATGVFSYGDLSANFNGMRFWNHMLQKHDDILGADQNLGPYTVCQDKKWAVNEKNPIDFKNYIDASMDESINCSKFAGTMAIKKFRAQVVKRGFVNSEGIAACPIEPEKLVEMENKYRSSGVLKKIINSEGNGRVNYFHEF